MPNMDRRGPEGKGPTGQGRGSCPNKDNLNTFEGRCGEGRRPRRGMGCGRGQGQGRGMGRKQGCGFNRNNSEAE
ncbi:MAG: hypothetical protein JXR30_00180 [Alphaproteobacteria bacterium]|nr:hypothetical protein [Alphaproteobacteria bacterium]